MKSSFLMLLVFAVFLAVPLVADDKAEAKKEVLPPGAEFVAELNGYDHSFFVHQSKDGKALLYKTKRLAVSTLTEEQKQQLKEQNPDGEARAARSPVLPGGRPTLSYLTTLPYAFLQQASAACQQIANSQGYWGSFVQGYPGAFHCYGQGSFRPTPIPEPWPIPYYSPKE